MVIWHWFPAPRLGWEFSWVQGWDGDRGCQWLYTGDPRWVIACLSPAQAAPCLVFPRLQGGLNTWPFLTRLHHPALASALTQNFSSWITSRGICLLAHFFLQTLLQLRGGNFPWGGEGDISWEHKPTKVRWRLSHCSQAGWATSPSPSHVPGESLFCPAMFCFSYLWIHRASRPSPSPKWELTEPRQLASVWGITLPLVKLHRGEKGTFPDPVCSQDPGHAGAGSQAF